MAIDYNKEMDKFLDFYDRALIIKKGMQSVHYSNRAMKEYEKFGLESLLEDKLPGTDAPRYKKEDFEALSTYDKKKKLSEGFEYREKLGYGGAIATIANYGKDYVLTESGKYSHKLLNLTRIKDIVDNAPEDKRDKIELHAKFSYYSSLKEKIEKNKKLEEEEKERLKEDYNEIISDKIYKSALNMGYGINYANMAATLSILAKSEVLPPKEKLLDTIDEKIQKIEEELKKKTGENYKDSLAEIIADTLVEMAKSSDPEKENKAIKYYSLVFRGYGPGERDFKEVY